MEAILSSGAGVAIAIADASPEMAEEAKRIAPQAAVVAGLDELLRHDIDGVVIATPSAQHAAQSIKALEAGVAAFCQKPLGRNSEEVEAVVAAAEKADRLLGVDLSYRYTEGMSTPSISSSTTLMVPTSLGSMTRRCQVVAASWTLAYIWLISLFGRSTSPRSKR
jgi:DNA-binding NarL/FixJ family response regulator